MSRKFSLEVVLISLFFGVFLHFSEAGVPCSSSVFKCLNGQCIKRSWFCDRGNDCKDVGSDKGSDEIYCDVDPGTVCPAGWVRCPSMRRCIPSHWMCDGTVDCGFISEEKLCGKDVNRVPGAVLAESVTKSWFLQRRTPGFKTDRWGHQVPRIAVALHLSDNTTFQPGNKTGEEIRYEIRIQLFHRLSKEKKISSHELALYVQAMVVACMNPRDFYGDDLVRELRRRVETSGNYTNPFLVLVLCNAGDTMTTKDVERMTNAYDSQHRLFWTDSQALASMALSCISSRVTWTVDERILMDMQQELKRPQFRNGTVENFKTTALVTQALQIHDSYKKDFDFNLAITSIVDGLNRSTSLLKAYYALPVLNHKSLLNATSSHCRKESITEDEALQKALDVVGEKIDVQYSIRIGDKSNVARYWKLKMSVNGSIYDVIETVAKIDNRQKVEYNVVDGKPYVTEINGVEDDPEMGTYWFIYLKSLKSDEDPKVVEESPVDIKLKPHQEIILWYKSAPWNG